MASRESASAGSTAGPEGISGSALHNTSELCGMHHAARTWMGNMEHALGIQIVIQIDAASMHIDGFSCLI